MLAAKPPQILLNDLKSCCLFQNIDAFDFEAIHPLLHRVSISAGDTLFRQNDDGETLFIIIEGQLNIHRTQGTTCVCIGQLDAGKLIDEMQVLNCGKRTSTITAITDAELLEVSQAAWNHIIKIDPCILQRLTDIILKQLRHEQLHRLLPTILGSSDDATLEEFERETELLHLKRGEALFRRGDKGDALYVVIHGHLHAIAKNQNGHDVVIGDITQGELVGEMGILTNDNRSADVYAVRDCELAKWSQSSFQYFISKYPSLLMHITNNLIHRQRENLQLKSGSHAIKNIVVIAISSDLNAEVFSKHLISALTPHGAAAHFCGKRIADIFCIQNLVQNDAQMARLSAYLDEQEEHYRFVIYQTDNSMTAWTKHCIQRADHILYVAHSDAQSTYERFDDDTLHFQEDVIAPKQSLILLHHKHCSLPKGTAKWLSKRKFDNHHHIRRYVRDFQRLARFISEKSVGLVFGGGGARGFAHYGVYMAIKQAGIAVDYIGGTSMGALIGAQCALGWDLEKMLHMNNEYLIKSNPFKEYTIPIIALLKGKLLKKNMQKTFGSIQIEDLWTNFFCISSNLSCSKMMIHQQGPLERAIRASTAIPGITVPVMENQNILVDGGLVNNIPGDIMQKLCHKVIVVDVGGKSHLDNTMHEMPAAWEIIGQRLFSPNSKSQAPSIIDVLMSSTLINSSSKANSVKQDVDVYLRPPIDNYKLLDFSKIDELIDLGYQYACSEIQQHQHKLQ